MGEDLARPQIPNLHFDFSPFLLNPVNLEHNSDVVLANEALPVDTCSKLLLQWRHTTRVDEPQGWYYRIRQATMPDLNTIIRDEAARKSENCRGRERRFLVVDQSPDRTTTLIFSSPLPCLACWRPNIDLTNTMNSKEDLAAEKRWIHDFDGKEKKDGEGVMEEDSEELNALLYSVSDEEEEREAEEEDEVTSTGHSPSTITTSNGREFTEDVASSHEPIRKRKAFDRREIDDDAESWCGGGRREEMGVRRGEMRRS